jgi:hypothetical protein
VNFSDACAAQRASVAKRLETMVADRGWTDAELIAAIDAGATKDEIKARFNRSWTALLVIMRKHGRIAPRNAPLVPDADKAALREDFLAGKSYKEMREKHRITHSQLMGRIERMGLPKRAKEEPTAEPAPMQMVLPAFDEAEPQPSLVFPSFYVAPAVPYVQVKPGTCEYLHGDAKPYIRCTEPSLPGKSWCEAHHKICCVSRVRQAA